MEKTSSQTHPFLSYAFRPFFMAAALYAIAMMFLWGAYAHGAIDFPFYYDDPVLWHAHEMIYGFTMAVVTGFLLTAVSNWTGQPPLNGIKLLGLLCLWLLGRVAMLVDLSALGYIAYFVQFAFIPVFAACLAVPLLRTGNRRNMVFLILLSGLWVLDILAFIYEDMTYLYGAMMIIMMMISIIGGRIIPFFTVNALKKRGLMLQVTPQMPFDLAALISLILVAGALLLDAPSMVVAILGFVSSGLHLFRMRHYHIKHIWRDPMLWILHLGYLWLCIGLSLLALSALDFVPQTIALHALTTGALGTMTLGMMCRVCLGHTGRDLIADKVTILLFILIQSSAVLRVFGPFLVDYIGQIYIPLAALTWVFACVLYVWRYAPYVWRPHMRDLLT